MNNKYKNRAHFGVKKFREILHLFCVDITATNTAEITGINRNTINKLFNAFRNRILEISINDSYCNEKGIFELDESYFGAKRIRGKRGRGDGLVKHLYLEY